MGALKPIQRLSQPVHWQLVADCLSELVRIRGCLFLGRKRGALGFRHDLDGSGAALLAWPDCISVGVNGKKTQGDVWPNWEWAEIKQLATGNLILCRQPQAILELSRSNSANKKKKKKTSRQVD